MVLPFFSISGTAFPCPFQPKMAAFPKAAYSVFISFSSRSPPGFKSLLGICCAGPFLVLFSAFQLLASVCGGTETPVFNVFSGSFYHLVGHFVEQNDFSRRIALDGYDKRPDIFVLLRKMFIYNRPTSVKNARLGNCDNSSVFEL